MKILFVGDYSNFHVNLAEALRRKGHEACVVSSGSRCMDTARDIDLRRTPGVVGGFKYLNTLFKLLPQLGGYDVVQLINPNFLDLKPGKIQYFFRQLKKKNRSVFLSLAGTDPNYMRAVCSPDNTMFRYSEYRIGNAPSPFAQSKFSDEQSWLTPRMLFHCDYICDNIDGAVSCLYEYDRAARDRLGDKLQYIGIPVPTDKIKFAPLDFSGKLNIFVGIKSEMEIFKGTDRLLVAAKEAERRYPDKCRVITARDLPYTEYLKHLAEAHIVLDQIYSYTPATNALEAMAMGKIAVSGAEPEYYDFIGEKELRPIVNVLPDDEDIFRKIENLILNPAILPKMAADGRKFVERHNDADIVAERYLKHIGKLL